MKSAGKSTIEFCECLEDDEMNATVLPTPLKQEKNANAWWTPD